VTLQLLDVGVQKICNFFIIDLGRTATTVGGGAGIEEGGGYRERRLSESYLQKRRPYEKLGVRITLVLNVVENFLACTRDDALKLVLVGRKGVVARD
jgi:hypothetical protein